MMSTFKFYSEVRNVVIEEVSLKFFVIYFCCWRCWSWTHDV